MRETIDSLRFAVAWLMLACGFARASEPLKLLQLDHTMWATRDGAPQQTMTMTEGPDGMLWIATVQGLYKFNGITFSLYEPPAGERWFSSAPMLQVYAAPNGVIWTSSMRYGLAAIQNGHVTFYDQHDGLPDAGVKEITQAPDGTMWVIAGGRLLQLRSGHWANKGGDLPAGEAVSLNFFDHHGNQWIATRKAVYTRTRADAAFVMVASQLRSGSDAVSFHETPDGKLLLALNYNLPQPHFEINQFAEEGDHTVAEPNQMNQPGWFTDLLFDRQGSTWLLGKSGGRFHLPQNVGSQSAIAGASKEAEEAFDSFPQLGLDMVDAGIVDHEGDVWLATDGALHRFRKPTLVPFIDRPLDRFKPGFAAGPDGTIWIATGGQPLLSLHNGVVTQHGPPLVRPFGTYLTEDGVMWLSNGQTLRKVGFDHETEVVPPEGAPAYTLHQALATPSHEYLMWFGGKSIWMLTSQGWTRTSLTLPAGFSPSKFFFDSTGKLWIGSSTGELAYVDGSNVVKLSPKAAGDLGMILSFFEDTNGLLVGGFRGVALYKNGLEQNIHFEPTSGVSGVSGMVKDKYGNLWLNGLHGVLRIPKKELDKAISSPDYVAHTEAFQESGSGPASQLPQPTAGKGDDGRLWFETGNLIVYVDPDHVQLSTVAPVVSLLSVTADGSSIGRGGLVHPGEPTVRIAYFGADLRSPESVTYRYRLNGIDKNWQNVGSRAEAVYTRLRPGTYTFQVKASNEEDLWSSPLETQFTVLPAFYQTRWFLFLTVLVFVTLLWIFMTWRVHQVARTMSRLALERADERVRIARGLHDTLLQGVQSFLLQCDVARQHLVPSTPAHLALSKALTTADLVLVEARGQVHGLRSSFSENTALVEAFADVGAKLSGGASAPAFHVETKGRTLPLKTDVSNEMYLAGREAITNAYRHAEASQIALIISYGMGRFTLTCKDDGRGMPDANFALEGHWGMRGMRERVTRIGGHFECRSAPNAGTEIVFSVPAQRAYQIISAARARWNDLLARAYMVTGGKALSRIGRPGDEP